MSVIMRNDIEVGGTDDGIIAKVGTDTLDTTAQDLSGAVNEHEEDISELNSSLSQRAFVGSSKSISVTVPSGGTVNIADANYAISGKTYIGTLITSCEGAPVSITATYAGIATGVRFTVHSFSSNSLTISIVYRHLYI